MNRIGIISTTILAALILVFTGCFSTDEGGDSSAKVPSDVTYVVQSTFSAISMLINDETPPTGMNFVDNDETHDITGDYYDKVINFTNFTDPDSGFTVNGDLNLYGEGIDSEMTVVLTGSLTFTSYTFSQVTYSITFQAPWDGSNDEFSGDPTYMDGTVTVDGGIYNLSDIEVFGQGDDEGISIIVPHFIVAADTIENSNLLVYSNNGSEWGFPHISQVSNTAADLNDVACNATGDCVAVGDGSVVLYSSDGINWSVGSTTITGNLYGVAFGNNRWVAVGESGTNGTAIYSDDGGKNWTTSFDDASYHLWQVEYGNGHWVAISGADSHKYSNDGITWQPLTLSLGVQIAWLYDIKFGNNRWVAVGRNDDNSSTVVAYAVSDPTTDAWSLSGSYSDNRHLTGLAYGNGYFIAVGEGMENMSTSLMLRTVDGETWTELTLPSEFTSVNRSLIDIAFGNGRWSAFGRGGDHLLSTDDGATWSVIVLGAYGGEAITFRP